MTVLGDFLNQLSQEADEETLWTTWLKRTDMGKCKPALKPQPQLGGLVPAQRASLAAKRVESLGQLKQLFTEFDIQPRDEQSERAILRAWDSHRVILGPTRAAVPYLMRADEAKKRLQTWEGFQKGLRDDEDEQIATAWSSDLLRNFVPARPHSERAKSAVERMVVIFKLVQCLKENPEDEDGLLGIVANRQDMGKCRPFIQPLPLLTGNSWKERLEIAARLLRIRAEINQTLSATPVKYDQLVILWDEKLCRNHRLFANDQNRIDEARQLGTHLLNLRQGIVTGNNGLIAAAWREEFRALMNLKELGTIREAMSGEFTGPNTIENLEFSLTPSDLIVRWDWRGPARFCLLEVADGGYPEVPTKSHPNAFRGEAAGGHFTIPFTGSAPHVRAWAMFRFLDEFVLGANPTEKRIETVEYSISKPLLRRYCLQLHSLSAKIALPSLIVSISDSPLWQRFEEIQRLPDTIMCGCITLELSLPQALPRNTDHYISLRPVNKMDEEWLRLIPRSSEAARIRL